MDHIKSQIDRLAELSDDQVSELQTSVISEFDAVEQEDPTPHTVDAMTSLADMLDTVRGEVKRREAQAEELTARAAEAAIRVRGEEDSAAPSGDADTEEDDEVIEEEEEKPTVAEASTEADKSAELSTETEITASTAPVEEAATELASEEVAEVVEAEVETPAEAPAELAVEVEAEPEIETPEVATEAAVEEVAEEAAPVAELAVEAEAEIAEEAPIEAEASNSEVEITTEQIAQEEAPVTAAAEEAEFSAPADRLPLVVQKTAAPVVITAGADVPGITAGSSIEDMFGVADAMTKRIHSLRNVNSGDGEQHIVASLITSYPESRVLSQNSEENYAKIQDVTGPAALVASGGHATPLEANYDIFGFGTDVRPVRDSLPRFQADRGGMRYMTPPQLKNYGGAVGLWTNVDDQRGGTAEAATPTVYDQPKKTLVVTGAQENSIYTDAITLQLQFGNFFARAYPELVNRHNELALIQHARFSEINLLNKIGAASTAVTSAAVLGVARDFLVQVKRAAAAYRSRHRIDPNTQLRGIVPSWVYDAIAADLTMNMPGDGNLGATRADINSYLALSNVTLSASLDLDTFGDQSAGALSPWPTTFKWFLFSEGTFLFIDGGTLDIGLIRDSTLVGTNDYKMFMETFETVAMVGIESLAITSTFKVDGGAAALKTVA